MRPRALAACAAGLLPLLLASAALAQISGGMGAAGQFRVVSQLGTSKQGKPIVWGYIYNDGKGGVENLELAVDVLDDKSEVIAQAQGEAPGSMVSRDRLYFEVIIPRTGAGYRVRVVNWGTFATGQ